MAAGAGTVRRDGRGAARDVGCDAHARGGGVAGPRGAGVHGRVGDAGRRTARARVGAARDPSVRGRVADRPRALPAGAPRARDVPPGSRLWPRARVQPHVRRSRHHEGRVVLLRRCGPEDAGRLARRRGQRSGAGRSRDRARGLRDRRCVLDGGGAAGRARAPRHGRVRVRRHRHRRRHPPAAGVSRHRRHPDGGAGRRRRCASCRGLCPRRSR